MPALCSPAPGPAPPLPVADRRALRRALGALEATDCGCPPYLRCPCSQECVGPAALLCPHCREECDCLPLPFQPPCRHVLTASARMGERFRRLLGEPPACGQPLALGELVLILADLARRHDLPPVSAATLDCWVAQTWGRLCALAQPDLYEGGGGEPEPADVLLRQDRVEVYRYRRRRHQSLYRADDYWQLAHVRGPAVAARNSRNGTADPVETFDRPAPPPPADHLEEGWQGLTGLREVNDAARRRRLAAELVERRSTT